MAARHSQWQIAIGVTILVGLTMAALSAQSDSPIGPWRLEVDWPAGRAEVTLTVGRTDGGLTATWSGPRGQLTPRDVAYADHRLTFTLDVANQDGSPIVLQFAGRIDGNAMSGQLLGPGGTAIAVTGAR